MYKLRMAIALAAMAAAGSAAAQPYPTRPITLIAPFPAGGPSDALARILSEPIRSSLGQPVVIENVAGAGGNIGIGRLVRSAPDGYTVGIVQWSTHVVNAVTYALPYDVLADFEPIALLVITPQLIIARKNFPASSVKELTDWLKANPDKASAATVGAAGGAQVTGVYFQQATGTRFSFVPYRGGAPAMQDLVSGQVDIMFDQGANALGPVKNGRDQGLCRAHQGSLAGLARRPIDRRGRRAVALRFLLAWPMGAEGHAEGDHRQAQRRGRERARRHDRTGAARRDRAGGLAARATDARCARRLSQGGDREMVADHPRLESQGGMKRASALEYREND